MKDEERKSIIAALRAAQAAAQEADKSTGHDGGTCNHDSAVWVLPKHIQNRTAERLAINAGVPAHARSWRPYGRCLFIDVSHGFAYKNTLMAEAATKAMQAHGLDATTYYQMD